MDKSLSAQSVALVINTYQQAHFLPASIESAMKQTVGFDEVIVVDDGSTDDPAAVVVNYPGVRLIRQSNAGLAAARNTGLSAASSDCIIFLDADDLLTPRAVSAGLACHAENPGAGLVYGAHRRIGTNGETLGDDVYSAVGTNAFRTFLTGNAIGMHATVVYDRRSLCDIGGFDATLPRCEDYDVYFRMALRYPIASHHEVTALYRWHGHNMSANHATMLKWVLRINDRQKVHTVGDRALETERLLGRRVWCRYYANEFANEVRRCWQAEHRLLPTIQLAIGAVSIVPRVSVELGRWALRGLAGSS
ncbi:glycosyltransferase family A protein [Bradyrhizobium sp. JYMT SZCCT0428]|uniref:glycosyltransferase family 2 protein n=1 Tax=Bradyrhizobium sp. JYMT SZCCT0428 TaxID=2807673 RepID=UPI001BA8281B|nr:glycosyltransferase family A protein [Bradyrhizobium sp. JYMT SZCCT0428]MBR1151563.1 glycosyltransferase family 2 protein [Bradyrhizobium sp. JYMT SZCCT0428]